eukprot:3292674-Rhodomonas_salina.1
MLIASTVVLVRHTSSSVTDQASQSRRVTRCSAHLLARRMMQRVRSVVEESMMPAWQGGDECGQRRLAETCQAGRDATRASCLLYCSVGISVIQLRVNFLCRRL